MKKNTQIATNPKRNLSLHRGQGGAMSEYRDVLPFAAGGALAGAVIGLLAKGSDSTADSLKKGTAAKGLVIGSLAAAALGLGVVAVRHV